MVGKMRASRKVTNKEINKQKTILISLFFIGISRQQISFHKSRHEERLSNKKGSSLAVSQWHTEFKYASKSAKEMRSSAMLRLNTVQYIFHPGISS